MQKVPDEVIVQFERGADSADRAEARADVGTADPENLGSRGLEVVTIADGDSVAETIRELESDPAVKFAERNELDQPASVPNDTSFGSLWGLENTGQTVNGISGSPDADVDATRAWDIGTGDFNTVVAIMDSGADLTHPDLSGNLWQNPGEVPGNGLDDDGNGFADDVNGYDFVNGEDPNPFDATGHGTHVAGTAAGVGDNGLGVTGVAQRASIMVLRVCSVFGCSTADQIQAINYGAANGARVLNGSLGGPGESSARRNAIFSHAEVLHVFAAGNDTDNVDAGSSTFPCASAPQGGESDNVLCVAATSQSDAIAGFSNFGPASVDLGAPGTNILSDSARRVHFSDNFNADDFATRWELDPDPGPDVDLNWSRVNEPPVNQPPFDPANFGITDSPGADYATNTDYATISQPVSVGAVSERGCELRFFRAIDLGAGDTFLVGLLNGASGQGYEYRAGVPGEDDTSGVETLPFPTSGAAGPLRVLFVLDSDGATVDDGVHVDDVKVTCGETPGPHDYGFLQGTSMASPHVAGAATLLGSRNPGASTTEIRDKLLQTVDPVASLSGLTATGGRLDIGSAMAAMPADTTITGGPAEGSTIGARSGRQGRQVKGASATFNYSSNDPATNFQCSVDGGAFAACGGGSQTIGALGPGAHSFAVRSVDPRGNADTTPARRNFAVEADPPQTTITKSPRKRTGSRKAKFRFTSDEPGSTFACRLDRKAFKPCTSPRKFKRVRPKHHRFQVIATDRVGNVDPTAAKRRWRVMRRRR